MDPHTQSILNKARAEVAKSRSLLPMPEEAYMPKNRVIDAGNVPVEMPKRSGSGILGRLGKNSLGQFGRAAMLTGGLMLGSGSLALAGENGFFSKIVYRIVKPKKTIAIEDVGRQIDIDNIGTYVKQSINDGRGSIVRNSRGEISDIIVDEGECVGVSSATPDANLRAELHALDNPTVDWQISRPDGKRDGLFPKNGMRSIDGGKTYVSDTVYCPTKPIKIKTKAKGEPSMKIIVMAEDKGKGYPGVIESDAQDVYVLKGKKSTPALETPGKTTPSTISPSAKRPSSRSPSIQKGKWVFGADFGSASQNYNPIKAGMDERAGEIALSGNSSSIYAENLGDRLALRAEFTNMSLEGDEDIFGLPFRYMRVKSSSLAADLKAKLKSGEGIRPIASIGASTHDIDYTLDDGLTSQISHTDQSIYEVGVGVGVFSGGWGDAHMGVQIKYSLENLDLKHAVFDGRYAWPFGVAYADRDHIEIESLSAELFGRTKLGSSDIGERITLEGKLRFGTTINPFEIASLQSQQYDRDFVNFEGRASYAIIDNDNLKLDLGVYLKRASHDFKPIVEEGAQEINGFDMDTLDKGVHVGLKYAW